MKCTNLRVIKPITFVSGNARKRNEVMSILRLSKFPRKVITLDIDLPELQGIGQEIAKQKCREAALRVEGPVLVEDTSLCFNALKGLPGPYIKWFQEKLKSEGLYRLLAGYEDKTAQAICNLCYCANVDEELHLFQGITEGKIVEPRGSKGLGWNAVFLPDGYDETFAEMDTELKHLLSHRYCAIIKLKKYLQSL